VTEDNQRVEYWLVGTARSLGWFSQSTDFLLREIKFLTQGLFCRPHIDGFRHFCTVILVHISPTRTGELNSHHKQSPMRVEGIHTTGCCPVPRRDGYDTAISTSVPCSLLRHSSHLGFGEPDSSSLFWGNNTLSDEEP
jgi:hypothetical protein